MDYIRKVLPLIVILENLEDLMEKSSESVMSDCDWIITKLQDLGYVCKAFVIDCTEYGSRVARKRLFLVGFKRKNNQTKQYYLERFS